MSSGGWGRVIAGMQMVAKAGAASTAEEVGVIAVRTAQHGAEVASSAQNMLSASAFAIQQQVNISSMQYQQNLNQSFGKHQKTMNGFHPDTNGFKARSSLAPSKAVENKSNPGTEETFVKGLSLSNETLVQEPTDSATIPQTEHQSTGHLVSTENQIRSVSANQHAEDVIQHTKEGKAVPATRFGRALGFANLGLGLAAGTIVEGASRLFGAGSGSGSIVVNDSNSDRLASSLCRMRGAALKMGQMLSIQDESLLPPALTRALKQVRQGAEAMPQYQLTKQLDAQLGSNWRDHFVTFDMLPFAAASIGQVHRATIKDTDTGEIRNVVVKVQYPGVAQSIESDLRNLSMLVTLTGLTPKGLFIENVIRVGTEELKVECDYIREKRNQKRIKELVESNPILCENKFVVPDVISDLTSAEVITSEYMPGGTIDKVSNLDQEEKNRIGRTILYLTMQELFVWRFMQTDPNWGNFLYDVNTRTTTLIDFGATREYSKQFVDGYLRIVWASANRDESALMDQSYKMNFLTGDENDLMLRAHKLSGYTVGEPFWTDEPFDFRGSNISTRMGEHTAVFLKHRLTPPPEEVYTLHRKLAGAYMLCIKLGAVVRCRDMLEEIVRNHVFEDGMENPITKSGYN